MLAARPSCVLRPFLACGSSICVWRVPRADTQTHRHTHLDGRLVGGLKKDIFRLEIAVDNAQLA